MTFIWPLLIVVAVGFGLIHDRSAALNAAIVDGLKQVGQLWPTLALTMMFWLGIMTIAERSGLFKPLERLLAPLIRRLFPDVSRETELYISSNLLANLLGLGHAATPFGLKAMERMQQTNKRAAPSQAMVRFLIMNTSCATLLPTAMIGLRAAHGAIEPFDIVIPTMIASSIAMVLGVAVSFLWKVER